MFCHLMVDGDHGLVGVLALQRHQGEVVREAEHGGGLPGVRGGERGPVRRHQRPRVVVEAQQRQHRVDGLAVPEVEVSLLIVGAGAEILLRHDDTITPVNVHRDY